MARSVFTAGGLIKIRVPEVEGTRDARGRFTSAQTRMRDRNRELAQGIQAQVVDNIQARITWRAESTGRLERITADPRNASYDTWHVGVGDEAFLDNSEAKYWRTFEQGSAQTWSHPFVGTRLTPRRSIPGVITGFWTSDKGRFVVRHEIQGRHAYRDAADQVDLSAEGIANLRQLVRDIIAD